VEGIGCWGVAEVLAIAAFVMQ